ncbi:MAG TPA: hypothetical protein VGE07_02285, partial [Herpetosiphonaceae bacterium]
MEEADPPACVLVVAGSGAWYERIVRAGPQREIDWRHAATGAEALRLARELAPPLIILDDELARAPGLADQLRQAGAGALIALSDETGQAPASADHSLPRRFG